MIRRFHFLLFVSIVALLGAVVAALATTQQRDFNLRGYVDATKTQDLPYRVPRLGVNVDLTQYDSESLTAQLEQMQSADIHWVRQLIHWQSVEPQQGHYTWDVWDDIFSSLSRFPSLEPVVVFVGSPQWATSQEVKQNNTFYPPDTPETFAQFVSAFAGRYADAIDYYQVWDEPNIKTGWGNAEPRVSDYAALLQASYTAIHDTDPNAIVLAAALAPTVETGPENISDIRYLRDLYILGGHAFADAFASKPYGFETTPDERTINNETLNFSRIIALREIMVEHGDGQKALWASSWGWNSLPDDWQGDPSIWGEVTSEEQITYTLQALDRAEREWPWLGGMVLQHWQPNTNMGNPLWGFALLDSNNQPTSLLNALSGRLMPTHATNGLYPARTPYARYSGTWTFSEFGADIGWVEDSYFEFDFTGSDIALFIREGDYVAHFYPQLDNADVNALPRDVNGNPYLLLRSDDLQPNTVLVPIARGLGNNNYTLRITADELVPDEIINRWPLIGYAVSSGDLIAPYDRQITIAWITAAIALASVLVTAWQINWQPLLGHLGKLWKSLSDGTQIAISAVTSMALLISMFITWGDGFPTIFRRDSVQIALSVLTSGLIYINAFGVVLTIIAALVLFVLIYNRLALGLMLVIFWSPFFLFPVELYRFAFPIAEVILLITASAWLLRMFSDWGRTRQTVPPYYRPTIRLDALSLLDFVVLLWVVLGVVSLTWAERRGIAITELRTLIVQPALFYVILRTLRPDPKTVWLLVDALLFAGFMVATIGIVMWLRGESVITAEEGTRRLAGVYGSPNNVGLFLGRCIPFALAFVLLKTDQTRRLIAGAILGVMLLAVVLSQSAGALFIGIPAAIAGVLLLAWRRRAVVPLLILGAIFLVGIVIASQSPRFSRFLDISQGTNFYRVRVWQSTFNVIGDHPITGLGLDQFLYEFRGQYIMPDAWEEPELSHPHNILLDFWAKLGVFGVFLLIAGQIAFWRRTTLHYRQHFRGNLQPLPSAILVGVMGSMLNLLAHGLVDNSVYVLDLAYVFVLLLGIAVILPNVGAIDQKAQ